MKILVTGGDGFIGSHLVPALKVKGYNVLLPKESFDVRKARHVSSLPKADFVIHLAAIASVPKSWKHPKKVFEVNTLGTLNMLQYCKLHSAKLIFPSSYMYGNPKYLPIDENHNLSAENPYAVSKLAAEELCKVYSKPYGLDVTVFRIFNVYGPRQEGHMVIPEIISKLLTRESAITIQSGKSRRDFIYITDVVNAFLKAIRKTEGYKVYNLGSGESWSIREAAEKLVSISRREITIIDKDIMRPNEIMNTVADTSKIKKELNWKPKVSIDKGLKKTYEEIKNRASNA